MPFHISNGTIIVCCRYKILLKLKEHCNYDKARSAAQSTNVEIERPRRLAINPADDFDMLNKTHSLAV